MRKCFAARSALWSALALGSFSQAAVFNTSWIAPGGAGSWGVSGNWSGGQVPNNGTPTAADTWNVFIDNGQVGASTVTLNTNASISNLSISAGDRLNIPQPAAGQVALTLAGGTITNAGTILGSGTSSSARGLTATGTTTLTGGGTVVLDYSGTGIQFGGIRGNNASVDRLVNVNNFITGLGLVGNGSLVIINSGTIAATVPAGSLGLQLTVFTADTGLVNTGTMLSRGGGDLRLLGFGGAFTFNNANGNIICDGTTGPSRLTLEGCLVNGGVVRVIGAGTITGSAGMQMSNGTIINSSSGVIERVLLFNSATLSNPAGGRILGSLNFDRSVLGTFPVINNAGEISMTLNNQQINHVGGTVTFAGGGSVNFPFAGNNYMARRNLEPTFDYPTVINQDHTFSGQGTFGAFSGGTITSGVGLNLINAAGGTFDANIPGGVMSFRSGFDDINYPAATITNNGTMKARNGGTLWFEAGAFVNNSTILIDSTSGASGFRMGNAAYGSFAAANLTGGTLQLNGGTALFSAGSRFTGGTLSNSAGGEIRIESGIATLGGRVNNAAGGTITIDIGGSLRLINASTYNNAGVVRTLGDDTAIRIAGSNVTLSGGGQILLIDRIISDGTLGTDSLTNLDNTISGAGFIGLNALGISNLTQGVIDANRPGLILRIDPSSIGLTNTGLLRARGGGRMSLEDGTFNNSGGSIRVDSSVNQSQISLTGAKIVGSGTIELVGTALGTLQINNGSSISGPIVNNSPAGRVHFTSGSYTLSSNISSVAGGIIQVDPATVVTAPVGVSVSGGLMNTGTFALGGNGNFQNVSGTGTLTIGPSAASVANHYRIATLNIGTSSTASVRSGGGTVGTSRINIAGLSINATARLDLNDHDMVIDYTTPSPAAAIRALLTNGYAAGSWNGNGIRSSSAAANATAPIKTALGYAEASALFSSFPATFSGQSVDSTTVLIAYTLYGDANLDRIVDIGDFAKLAANFNIATARWDLGDFNYSGSTDIGDFSLLAANFNQSLPAELPRQSIPEPVAFCVALLLIAHQRRCPRVE